MLTDLILTLVKLIIEKVILEQGKELDWAKIKKEVQDKLDQILPPSVWEDVAKYLVGLLIDIVSAYFTQHKLPFTADSINQAVTHANGALPFEVAKVAAAAVLGKTA